MALSVLSANTIEKKKKKQNLTGQQRMSHLGELR